MKQKVALPAMMTADSSIADLSPLVKAAAVAHTKELVGEASLALEKIQ